ncbi:dynein regulation protein LC7 [Streptomyces sp. AS58]|uniref:Roadblock/LC7 domain-containing protein n=1 Tax=Streptomyces cadmiisoli TaxID=2184053 RepID=A0A2Z4JDZ7_9ACTN|nr:MULTISPECIES: roadblock/LC7 domain-containing protein [Streptomyces]AWW43286.1 roadblock/LC7 domain-containing protein [Streptomyces cadmiisoli]KOV51079.1 dynein regulation protein LC7 [Streptomyces sp. AS58]
MTRPSPATHTQLDQLLTGLVERVADVNQAVVLSEDGLVVSKSTSFPREEAERVAATAAGLMSLSKGVSRDVRGGPVRQALIEMADCYLILTSAGPGAHLVVLTGRGADVGVVAYQMNMLVKKIGEHLSAAPRGAAGPAVGPGV